MGSDVHFNHIRVSANRKFLTSPTDNRQVAYLPPTIKVEGTTTRLRGLSVKDVKIFNRGAASHMGIAVRIPTGEWVAGQWTNATTTFTDDTTDAQDAGTSDFALDTLNTNNNGFCIGCRALFNVFAVDVGTATAGVGPAWADAIRYSQDDNAGGVAWATMAASAMFVAPDFSATGERLVLFDLPTDFVIATDPAGLGTGFPPGYAWINVRATTSPTSTAGLATTLSVGRAYGITEAVADAAVLEYYESAEERLEPLGDALVLVSSVVDAGNTIEALVRAAW